MKTRQRISISMLIILVVGTLSCAIISSKPVSIDEKFKAADRKIELAEHVQACKEHVRLENRILPKAGKLYKQALKVYLKIIERQPDGEYAQLAHFRAAETHQKRSEWDDVTAHYQATVDVAPTSYLGVRAQEALDEIRTQRQRIAEKLSMIDTSKNGTEIPQALFEVAQAHEKIGDYSEAIRFYERLVSEFSGHQLAAKAQYQVGDIYFYRLYNYTDEGGWGAFLKVTEQFPDSPEAQRAMTLLKQSYEILKEIGEDREDLMKLKNMKRAVPHRYISGSEDRTVQNYQSISENWLKLRNYPCTIAAYRELIREVPDKRFAVANAWYQIGLLYQQCEQFYRAINTYGHLIKNFDRSTRRLEGMYHQAICYRAIREYQQAYENVKAYVGINYPGALHLQDAQRMVEQMERDEDGDGAMFYQEQEAGTSDLDANDSPRPLSQGGYAGFHTSAIRTCIPSLLAER